MELIFIFLPSLLFISLYKIKLKDDIGFVKTRWKYFIYAFLLGLASIFIINFLNYATLKFFPQFSAYFDIIRQITSFKHHKWFVVIFFIAVIPPFFEELFFRGIILNLLDKNKGVGGIILSSMIFAMFHLDIFAFLQIFILGMILGYLYKISNSIFVPMFFHFLINFFSVISSNYFGF